MEFTGRTADLELLGQQLRPVAEGRPGGGKAVVVTGRRRVGKSRLVQEFCDRSGLPYVIFQATHGRNPSAERADFIDAIAQSSFPGADLVTGIRAGDWNQALRALAVTAHDQGPSIAVIDEVPWLVEQDREFEGALQTVWDRYLSAKPVLLILVGSDISVMDKLQSYGRPFFGRAVTMTVRPLNLADVAEMTGLDGADAIDALLLTGGFPEIVRSWPQGMSREGFLRETVANPLAPLLAAGELSLLGEFPEATVSRAVLEAVGSGETTFKTIAMAAGGGSAVPGGTLSPVLRALRAKGVLTADTPLSCKPDDRNKRYRIADPYLRCWLALLRRAIPLIERGRGDLALARIEGAWPRWRGRAIEPVVRESLLHLLPDAGWAETQAVGGWWNRQNNPEIDIVGADRAPVAAGIHFLGSIKWLENRSFGRRDYDRLARDALSVPGADGDTPLVAVSRCGTDSGLPLTAHWGPEDLVQAWL